MRDVLEKATVEAWMVVVKLLQDDDDDLRDVRICAIAANRVLMIVQSVAKFAATLAYEGSKLPVHNSVIVSRAIQLAFDYLTQNFASSEHYFEYLVKLVVQSEDIATSMNRDHVEDDVLFETEEDNIFFENVSLIQFATYHINEILAADSSLIAKRKARLAELLPSAVSYLNAAIQWMKQAQVRRTDLAKCYSSTDDIPLGPSRQASHVALVRRVQVLVLLSRVHDGSYRVQSASRQSRTTQCI